MVYTPRVGLAVLVLAVAAVGAVAVAAVGEVVLNTADRVWLVSGSLEFTVAQGSATVGGIEVGPGDRVAIVVSEGFASPGDYLKLWIGTGGWVVAESDSEYVKLVVNGVEVASGSWELRGVRADPGSLESSLTVHVPPSPAGWTDLEVDGVAVIDSSIDSSDIRVVGLTPSSSVPLNLDAGDQYLRSAAESVEVNGQEVPWATAQGALMLAGLGLAAAYWSARRGRRPRTAG